MLRASAAFSGLKSTWLASATWKTPSLNDEVMRATKSLRKSRRCSSVHTARRKVTRHSVRCAPCEPADGLRRVRQPRRADDEARTAKGPGR